MKRMDLLKVNKLVNKLCQGFETCLLESAWLYYVKQRTQNQIVISRRLKGNVIPINIRTNKTLNCFFKLDYFQFYFGIDDSS